MKIFHISILLLLLLFSGCSTTRDVRSDSEFYARYPDAEFDPVSESAELLYRGKLSYMEGDLIEASVFFQRAIGFDYYNPEPHILLASVYFNLGWYDFATFELNRTVELLNSPEWRGMIFFIMGSTYYRQGKYEDAYGKYKQAKAEGFQDQRLNEDMKDIETTLKIKKEKPISESESGENEIDKRKKTEFEKNTNSKVFYEKYFNKQIKKTKE